MFLLSSDSDTLTGMRLAGIEGVLVKNQEEFDEAVAYALSDKSIGILLVTKTVSDEFAEGVLQLKKNNRILVTQIPDMKNPTVPGNSITRYVQDAVGIRIE
ncbi:MAG: V-type ATP synthase subunit F [Acutalibacteraceae bacterium]